MRDIKIKHLFLEKEELKKVNLYNSDPDEVIKIYTPDDMVKIMEHQLVDKFGLKPVPQAAIAWGFRSATIYRTLNGIGSMSEDMSQFLDFFRFDKTLYIARNKKGR